tara:strand:- start:2746 stop:3642 length:897 start_codon:yes stop_codon:yes gene_type:complete
MKVYDCTLYHDEDLILDLRLNILSKFIDKFVICESRFSHSGREKKLNFDINNFSKFKDKIIYLVLDSEPKGLLFNESSEGKKELPEYYRHNAIRRIAHQRNKLIDGLKDAENNDFILYSDNDEIPNLENFNFKTFNKKYILFKQKLFYYKFNLHLDRISWYGTKGCKKKYLLSFEKLRQIKPKIYPFYRIDTFFKFDKQISLNIVNNGGWHFTRLQTPEDIHLKELDAEHHDEYRLSGKNINKIRELIKNRKIDHDHFADTKKSKYGQEFKLSKISINSLPKFIQENEEKYKEWFDYD